MTKSPEEMANAMKAGILEKTGHPVDHWVSIVRSSGLEKHGAQMKLLKDTHAITHGYANFICQVAKGRLDANEDDLLEGQYVGKEHLRPIYDALEQVVCGLGDEVEISPKKTSVAFRRSKNFAVVTPATKTRLDVGINLKGDAPTARLKAEKAGAMCTHKVGLSAVDEVDEELVTWLKRAFSKA